MDEGMEIVIVKTVYSPRMTKDCNKRIYTYDSSESSA